MKFIPLSIAVCSLLISQMSAAEYFCISDQGKPKHCEKGDIILVKPTLMPRVCDFDAQILRMPKNAKTAEYLCRYTGVILDIKELQSRRKTMNQKKPAPPPPAKRKNNNMFNNMPFFK